MLVKLGKLPKTIDLENISKCVTKFVFAHKIEISGQKPQNVG
jgi:hypothetical protein